MMVNNYNSSVKITFNDGKVKKLRGLKWVELQKTKSFRCHFHENTQNLTNIYLLSIDVENNSKRDRNDAPSIH